MTVVVMNAWQVLLKGGPMMWPIILLSIIAMGIGINRLMLLSSLHKGLLIQKQDILDSLVQGKLKDTLILCEAKNGILGRILKAGILKFGSSSEIVKLNMQEVFDYEMAELKRHMPFLSLIVNVAPLLGLLGTVNAMTVVFHAAVIRSNVLNPLTAGELASGIWQALLTTIAGLVVAILSLSMYSFCAARINGTVLNVQRSMTQMFNILQQLSELRVTEGEHQDEV